jgi:hypothetical protein
VTTTTQTQCRIITVPGVRKGATMTFRCRTVSSGQPMTVEQMQRIGERWAKPVRSRKAVAS